MSEFPPATPGEIVRAYHQRTAHRFEGYARGPEALDWDAQPAPFRHFDGAPRVPLPRLANHDSGTALAAALERPFRHIACRTPIVDADLAALAALLQLSLGITAWKGLGPDRWAVRANPSSGNLHPLEAYLVVESWPGLADGVYHYRAEDHTLEQRAVFGPGGQAGRRVLIGLTSVMWREAWKYGERAFRYCQLDVGHGVGALVYAAAALGWRLTEVGAIGHGSLARVLGIDRPADFPWRRRAFTEQEEPERLLELRLPGAAARTMDVGALLDRIESARWMGVASSIDPFPLYDCGVMGEVALATRRGDGQGTVPGPTLPPPGSGGEDEDAGPGLRAVIQGRRSAQRFDPACGMAWTDFAGLMAATRPVARAPWDTLARQPGLDLILFVHRVEGLAPGIYLLARHPEAGGGVRAAWEGRLAVETIDAGLGLSRLQAADPVQLRRVARSLHCHQDIAATACFALGMVGELDHAVEGEPVRYRDLHVEAGLLGQVLYLEAEARGFQGTGIGCYFDEPVREVAGLAGSRFWTFYHFTVGRGVADPRIETGPAYPD